MLASDLMTRAIFAVGADTPVSQAIRIMGERNVSGLPVVGEGGVVIGMITEGDLLRRVETGTADKKAGWLRSFLVPGHTAHAYVHSHGRRVGEVMTSEVVTATEQTPLTEVVDLMQRHHVKRIPIVRDGRLCGLVTRADVVRRVGEALSAAPVDAEDGALRQAIYAAMKNETWAPVLGIAVEVDKGVVHLDGCLFDIHQREALTVLAENVPGVRRVDNRIVCIEPHSGILLYDPAEGSEGAR